MVALRRVASGEEAQVLGIRILSLGVLECPVNQLPTPSPVACFFAFSYTPRKLGGSLDSVVRRDLWLKGAPRFQETAPPPPRTTLGP